MIDYVITYDIYYFNKQTIYIYILNIIAQNTITTTTTTTTTTIQTATSRLRAVEP